MGVAGIAGMLLLERRLPRVPAALVVLLASIAVSVRARAGGRGRPCRGRPAGWPGAARRCPGVGLEALPLLLVGAVGHRPGGLRRGHRSGQRVRPRARRSHRPQPGAHRHRGRQHQRRPVLRVPHRLVALEVGRQRPGRRPDPDVAGHRGRGHGARGAVPDAALRAPAGGDPGRHRHRGGDGHDEGGQDAPALGPAAGGLLAGHDRPRGRPGRAHPAGPRHRRGRVAGRPRVASERAAPDVPGASRRRAGAARPADGAGVGRSRACSSCVPTRCSSSPTRPRSATASWRRSARTEPPPVVLLDLSLTPEVDVPVVEVLEGLHGRLADQGIELWVSHLRPGARSLLARAGALDRIGAAAVHPRVVGGILAFALRTPGGAERTAVLQELLDWIGERKARPGTSAEGIELLEALEDRLRRELAVPGETPED